MPSLSHDQSALCEFEAFDCLKIVMMDKTIFRPIKNLKLMEHI